MSPSAQAAPQRPPVKTPYALIGGEPEVRRLVETFYDAMEQNPAYAALRAIHAPDLGPMRARLADYLTQWMGGPRVYAERHPGRGCIVSAHGPFAIDGRMADQWLACMREAFEAAGVAPAVRAMLDPAFSAMCQGLRNDARPS
jgi:hemoglobin